MISPLTGHGHYVQVPLPSIDPLFYFYIVLRLCLHSQATGAINASWGSARRALVEQSAVGLLLGVCV